MKFDLLKTSAIATGVALAFATIGAQAATQPSLTVAGAATTAKIMGGATVNGGASYLTEVPAEVAADLVATIAPAAGDVGKTGSIVVIAEVGDLGYFVKLSGGIWIPWDGSSILPTVTKTLAASESVTVLDGLVGNDTSLAGLTIKAYVGYYTGAAADAAANITYTAAPMEMKIAEKASASCPTGTTAGSGTYNGTSICNLPTGLVTTDLHLTNNFVYLLAGKMTVGTNTTAALADKTRFTLDAGVTVISPAESNAPIVIDRGGAIFANGNAEHPVVFTVATDLSSSFDAFNTIGQWGGLVVNGAATVNPTGGIASGEGDSGEYGGADAPVDTDSSGAITYTQIKYAGYPFTETNELNSLALQGVGSGTIIDYVHIHNGADDGIEFFGGTVDAKHLVLTGIDDDALDWTEGYTGRIQHAIIESTATDNCIEADNNSSSNLLEPRSIPVIANLTCVGYQPDTGGHAFEIKEGTGMKMYNSVVGGSFPQTKEGCIRIGDEATFTLSGANIAELNGTLVMENSFISTECAGLLTEESSGMPWTTADWFGAQTNTSSGTVDLGGTFGWSNSNAINRLPAADLSDPFFDDTDYIGAIKDASSDWTQGWIFTPPRS